MSDAGRKGVTDQLSDKITPDSQKSTLDQAKEQVTGAYDRAAGALQPEDQKSTGQKVSDSVRSGSDETSAQGKSLYQQASDTVSGAAQSVGNALSGEQKK